MKRHEIKLHHEKGYDGKFRAGHEGIHHICGVKCHIDFDPHGLDDWVEFEDGSVEFQALGEIIIDCEKPLNISLKYSFENTDKVYDLHMHQGGDHYTAMVSPSEITGNLVLVY